MQRSSDGSCLTPSKTGIRVATHYTKQIIIAKLRIGYYARSNYIGAKLLAEEQAKIASEQEEKLTSWWWVRVSNARRNLFGSYRTSCHLSGLRKNKQII